MEIVDQKPIEVMEINCNEENNMCQVSKQLQQLLYEHFLINHSETVIIEDQFVQQCNCIESKELQKQIINHLLSHLVPPFVEKREEEQILVETLDPDDYVDDYSVEEHVAEEVYVEEQFVEADEDENEEHFKLEMEGDESFQTIVSVKTKKEAAKTIYKCTHCEWESLNKKAIIQHLQNEHEENSPMCCPYAPACNNVFKSQKVRQKHINWHKIMEAQNEFGQLFCQTCGVFCANKDVLLSHISSHNRYYCDYCDKSYASFNNMKRHVISHIQQTATKSAKKMVVCELCTQLVPSERMKRHIYTFHCDEKLFSCKICLKEFKHAESLKSHMDIHSGQPRFQCEYCNKTFYNCSNYKSHLFRHTEPDRFKCSVCFKRYGSSKSLQQHFLRNHENLEGREKFICSFAGCSKFYYLESLLKAHINQIHNKKAESPQPCPICKYVANSKKNIQRHKWRVHKIKTRNQKVFTD